jgi:hypothetical protein
VPWDLSRQRDRTWPRICAMGFGRQRDPVTQNCLEKNRYIFSKTVKEVYQVSLT